MTAHEASGLFLEYLNTYSAFMFGYVGLFDGIPGYELCGRA